jgi:hypothetical protein
MQRIEYTDDDGYKKIVELPDSASNEEAAYGILIGPPDLDELDLPERLKIKLNNELFDRGLITYEDVKSQHQSISSALKAVFKADVVAIVNLYKEIK